MRVLVYSAQNYDREFLNHANEQAQHDLDYTDASLNTMTVNLARGYHCVCCFVNDDLGADTLDRLCSGGVRFVALRCAGFNNVDLETAQRLGVTVARVPSYSPEAVSEFTVSLMLSLLRKVHRAYIRVREGNFSLEGLLGTELHSATVGVVGHGSIGSVVCRTLASGFGCRVQVFDPYADPATLGEGVTSVGWPRLLAESDIITLHCPLTPKTHHLIDADAINQMKQNVVLINTSRGAIVDAASVIDGLKKKRIGAFGMDVYEEEGDVFYHDLSEQVIEDDDLARLMTFPNVLITGHQAFFTRRAMEAIAQTTIQNISDFQSGSPSPNALVRTEVVMPTATQT